MPLYVDALIVYPNAWGPFAKGSCHLFADAEDEAELHAIAARIGLRRSWFQPDPRGGHSHYDLTPRRRRAAIEAGARVLDTRGAVAVWRANRAKVAARGAGVVR